MEKSYITFIFLIFFTVSYAQTDTVTHYGWIPSGVTGLNISQIAFSNWTQGGENSITWTIFGNFALKYILPSWVFTNELKLAYGRTKPGTEEFRTNDNELYLETVLSHSLGWAVDPYISNTLRTAVSDGFNYDSIPALQTSALFDPAYITQSIGFTYNKLEGFTTRLGLAFQETVTDKYRQYSDDPETPDEIESFKFETGLESVTSAEYTVAQNMLVSSKLRLFTRFEAMDVWDVRWDNTITAKVNDYVNVNLNVLLVYEKSQSPKTQLKEALQLGLTYNLF
ncbi:MAG: hypothetical protein Kow0098_09750 [Ignavibacteriaceae bacterium]